MMKKNQEDFSLSSELLGIGFKDLNELVVEQKNCILCGLCSSLCPRIGLDKEKPTLLEYDPECSMCLRMCSRTNFPKELIEKKYFNNGALRDPLLGPYKQIIAAKSCSEKLTQSAQNGGSVSALLIHALETGIIDGALLTDRHLDWTPKPFIARSAEEIIAASGSKYTMSPSLLPYKDAIEKYNLEKLAFVGMPCQIKAIRKLQIYPPLSEIYGRFSLVIGLFCSANFSHNLLDIYIKKVLNLNLRDIEKMDINRGKFIIHKIDGTVIKMPLKEILNYKWPACEFCRDYSAEYADISIGSEGSPSDNWNSIIIRTQLGENLFNNAVKSDKLLFRTDVSIPKIEKACSRKKSKYIHIDEEIITALRNLNLSDVQIELYITLVNLGQTDNKLLEKTLNLEESVFQKGLKSLVERGWIIKSNGILKPNNPDTVLQQAIKEFQQDYEKKVDELKQKALNPLRKAFIQNNSERMKMDELLSS